MAVTLPKILVTFTQLATSFIQRSARGIAVLIVRDDTAGTGKTFFQYGDATQVSDTEFTPANQQYIKDALSFGPLRVSVVKIKTADDLAAAAAIFTQYEKTGWVTFAEGSSDDWTDLSSWIKAQEKAYKSWKAVCFKAAAPDSMHIVNLSNEKVTFADTRGEASGEKYCASLAGLLASCNVEQGATNKLCPNLTRVAVPEGSSRLPLLPVIRPWPLAHLRASAAQALTEALSAKPERSPPAVTSYPLYCA